ncbi:MAG: zinc ribbon domain-containing protein [Agathobacter sp.]|nr:zinc ribbon domain-containing protein [Agathobacter sp.]
MAYCNKCGSLLDDDGRFCGNCGTPIDGMESEAERSYVSHEQHKKYRCWKIIIPCLIVAMLGIFGISRMVRVSDKPCDWCQHKPTIAYRMSDDSYSYVCKDCRKKCAWCGKRATRHYENLAHMMVFVCKDCYDEIVND